MSLRDRLQQIRASSVAPEAQELEVWQGDPTSESQVDPPLESLVEGTWHQVGKQRCFVAERTFPLEQAHGGSRFGDLLQLPAQVWTPLVSGGGDASIDPRRALFVDTETTGLMRGPGTHVFMVGIGLFLDDGFCVRQYFMPDYEHEGALLELLGQDLERREGLISFNGRSFDWPLIQMRYGLWGEQPPGPVDDPHLDLLLVSRRLWRRRLDSCSLSSLEGSLLGVRRTGADVPGYLIPQLYLDYLREGRTRPMAGIFYHNQVDILSLVALAGRIGLLLHEPSSLMGDPHFDAYSLGRLFERTGQTDRAIAAYRMGEESGREGEPQLARESLSFLLKRLARDEEAVEIWEAELNRDALYPYLELAKYYEHHLRDYERAKELTCSAIERVEAKAFRLDAGRRRQVRGELEHRLSRLGKRLRNSQ